VAADDGEVGHADHLGEALLDKTHAAKPSDVAREELLDRLKEVQVHKVNEVHVPGQEVLKQRDRPLLEGLGRGAVRGGGVSETNKSCF